MFFSIQVVKSLSYLLKISLDSTFSIFPAAFLLSIGYYPTSYFLFYPLYKRFKIYFQVCYFYFTPFVVTDVFEKPIQTTPNSFYFCGCNLNQLTPAIDKIWYKSKIPVLFFLNISNDFADLRQNYSIILSPFL